MADETSCEKEIILTMDCSNTIRGLKAIQREAKKATRSLRELEEKQNELDAFPIRAEVSE